MFGKAVLCLSTLHFYSVSAQAECTDLRGRLISHGLHYVPGPDTCTLCICDNGQPKVCKAVLCSPPQDCRSFRVGTTCCEFICLDDVVKPAEGAEANVRMAAGGAAAVVLVTVALVVYRVRKQKRRRNTHADDQRSMNSIGYISGSMGYMGGQCETSLGAWKPPGNYLPRGEAPPPYDEVIAQCRSENARMAADGLFHRTYPTTVEALARPDDSIQCNGHSYVNIQRPVQQIANPQNCYNAPLLQAVHPTEVREPNPMTHHALAANMSGLGHRARLTGSLGAISGRLCVARGDLAVTLDRDLAVTRDRDLAISRDRDRDERPHNVPGFYTTPHHLHPALHRTIPRLSPGVEALEPTFRRADCGGGITGGGGVVRHMGGGMLPAAGEVRRSFHRPAPARRDTGRSVPRHLDLASAGSHLDDNSVLGPHTAGGRSRAHSSDDVGGEPSPPLVAPLSTEHATLPLTVDKPSCVCSYSDSSAPAADEHDDYRSECENCKSASSSRWVLEEGWADETEEGTQTLQRRAPPPPAPPAPATATLPQPVTKQPRNAMGPPSNWENWFNTIPDSDTESEEE